MDVAVSTRVQQRDAFGQFAAQIKEAGVRTMREAEDEMVEAAKNKAPVGHKPDPRTIKLRDSIKGDGGGETARVVATARHALPQETGAGPHDITGMVRFFWEREAREWTPGHNRISHPGNPATHYLRDAYRETMARIMQIARRYYPQ